MAGAIDVESAIPRPAAVADAGLRRFALSARAPRMSARREECPDACTQA